MKWFLLFCFGFISCQPSNRQPTVPEHQDTVPSATTKENPPQSDSAKQVSDNRLIVPGESVGQTGLGLPSDSLESLLGRPDLSDAAMGKAWLTWKGKRDEHNNATELNIYTAYKDNTMRQKTVQLIHTTSAYFSTTAGISVYSNLATIRKTFPGIKKTAQYTSEGRTINIYDDQQQGISFEIASANKQALCTGIIVHQKGESVTNAYQYFHPEMKKD